MVQPGQYLIVTLFLIILNICISIEVVYRHYFNDMRARALKMIWMNGYRGVKAVIH